MPRKPKDDTAVLIQEVERLRAALPSPVEMEAAWQRMVEFMRGSAPHKAKPKPLTRHELAAIEAWHRDSEVSGGLLGNWRAYTAEKRNPPISRDRWRTWPQATGKTTKVGRPATGC